MAEPDYLIGYFGKTHKVQFKHRVMFGMDYYLASVLGFKALAHTKQDAFNKLLEQISHGIRNNG